jgi:hypothetical protein
MAQKRGGRTFWTLLLAVAALLPAAASSPVMPVSEIKAGMVGVGRTVFIGTRLDEFKAHILGILENAMGPSRNLILARLEGGPLAETGVIAGMSGSPVYIDGRLIGAVSYSLGAFSREPIAGITPIDEMIDATRSAAPRAGGLRARADLSLPLSSASLAAALQQTFTRTSPFAESPYDVRPSSLLASMSGADLGVRLRPIATPLVMGGFRGEVADLVASGFGASGFAPIPTGAAPAGAGTTPSAPLAP